MMPAPSCFPPAQPLSFLTQHQEVKVSEWPPSGNVSCLTPPQGLASVPVLCSGPFPSYWTLSELRSTISPICGRFLTEPACALSLPEAYFSWGDFSGQQKAPGGVPVLGRRDPPLIPEALYTSLWNCRGQGFPALWEDPVFLPLLMLH